DPTGAITSYTWDTGFIKSVTDGRGNRGTFGYLTLGNNARALQTVQSPLGFRYTFLWDTTNNRVKGLVDQLGNRSTLLWDGSGNRTGLINALNQRVTYGYNTNGQIKSITNALNQRATILYDSAGRKVADINPLGFRTSYAYTSFSQRKRVQDPLGNITTFLR